MTTTIKNLASKLSILAVLTTALASVACDGDDDHYSYVPSSGGSSGSSSGSSSSSSGSSGSSGGSSADEHPSWLVGPSYTKGYKVENNIAFESDDIGIKFGGAPDYKYETKTGKSWSKSGTWKVQSSRVVLSAGSDSISLSDVTANCHILKKGSQVLYTTEKVTGCPTSIAKPLTSSECAKVGTYSKGTQSGSSSSSHSTSTTFQLDASGVLIYTTGSSQSTCYGSTCKTLSNSSAPVVGRWWLSGLTVMSDASTTVSGLSSFEFTESSDACPN